MTAPLFALPDPDPAATTQDCQRCQAEVNASDDRLRVLGWMVYNGRSQTGKRMHVRICPKCQITKGSPS